MKTIKFSLIYKPDGTPVVARINHPNDSQTNAQAVITNILRMHESRVLIFDSGCWDEKVWG